MEQHHHPESESQTNRRRGSLSRESLIERDGRLEHILGACARGHDQKVELERLVSCPGMGSLPKGLIKRRHVFDESSLQLIVDQSVDDWRPNPGVVQFGFRDGPCDVIVEYTFESSPSNGQGSSSQSSPPTNIAERSTCVREVMRRRQKRAGRRHGKVAAT